MLYITYSGRVLSGLYKILFALKNLISMVITLVFALLGYAMIPWLVEFGLQLWRVKQSNSWNILKLILPSFSWEIISGWANHSGKVTIYKIFERVIDDRGSKSITLRRNKVIVKEPRVYGCWCIFLLRLMHLKCTLKGFKWNYLIKTLSKQFK